MLHWVLCFENNRMSWLQLQIICQIAHSSDSFVLETLAQSVPHTHVMWGPHWNPVDNVPRHARNSITPLPAHLRRHTHQCCSQRQETQCGIRFYGAWATAWVFLGPRAGRNFCRYHWLESWMVHVRWSHHVLLYYRDMEYTRRLLDTGPELGATKSRY